ncbi:hypothetical protein H9P43_001022 [Blastocladiella emersonii ATCC 22665]|nr:hypothetical protein H9P43_001022 [Blastocladiella emersonii ATCC 22665]
MCGIETNSDTEMEGAGEDTGNDIEEVRPSKANVHHQLADLGLVSGNTVEDDFSTLSDAEQAQIIEVGSKPIALLVLEAPIVGLARPALANRVITNISSIASTLVNTAFDLAALPDSLDEMPHPDAFMAASREDQIELDIDELADNVNV